VWGLNYDLTTEASTFGASYLRLHADPAELPERNGMTVFNVRAYTAPAPTVPDLSFEFEYAREQNGDLLRSDAWTLLAGYRLSQVAWTPRLSYRYAFFEGDDPETPTNESFDMLLPGFYDWGTWWQGEIAGEYFLANSNLVSHQVRLHTAPTEAIGTGLILYRFLLDKPAALDPAVTSKNLAVELDWYMDWDLNGNFTVSFVGAYANPKTAVQQAYDRTKSFWYGMAYVVYSY